MVLSHRGSALTDERRPMTGGYDLPNDTPWICTPHVTPDEENLPHVY
jgi:hypothetical protein